MPDDAEAAISGLESKHCLTRQSAFDYFRGESSGRFLVIQCNSRVFSGLEGVSNTPSWCANPSGGDDRSATQYQTVGVWFHRESSFAVDRSERFWSIFAPLPVLVMEIAGYHEMLRMVVGLLGRTVTDRNTGNGQGGAGQLGRRVGSRGE